MLKLLERYTMNNLAGNKEPKVSIIMGIYNCADTLAEAIDSILSQTFWDWELIMCDDGSKDNTLQIAEEYASKFPEKIFVIKNVRNYGLNYTLNHCLKYVRGEYVARMDGDDISLSHRLQIENDFLDSHPEYAIVSSPIIYFDEKGDWGEGHMREVPQLKDFVFDPPVHCHAPCMIRTKAYMDVGGYTVDDRLLRFEDWNLWHKLYSKGYRGYNLQEPLYKMRDDRNAYHRRTPSSRLRSVYVQYIGFRMLHMPLRYYPYLLVEFLRNLLIVIMPEKLYAFLHKRKYKGQAEYDT